MEIIGKVDSNLSCIKGVFFFLFLFFVFFGKLELKENIKKNKFLFYVALRACASINMYVQV